MPVWTWITSHKALIAALIYATALAVSGQYEVAAAVALAALSGGIKPVPTPSAAK